MTIATPPQMRVVAKDDVMSYAGMFSGAWGGTVGQVDQALNNLHDEWGS